MRWINTKVIYSWNGSKYIEKYVEGYYHYGDLALCDVLVEAGAGGGGGGGAGGSGGTVVFITSHLTQPLIDDSSIYATVNGGSGGAGGETGGDASTYGTTGYTGGTGTTGKYIKIIL